jgi:hypothetical protein
LGAEPVGAGFFLLLRNRINATAAIATRGMAMIVMIPPGMLIPGDGIVTVTDCALVAVTPLLSVDVTVTL